MSVERLSIELTNLCSKGCWFCYNQSTTSGTSLWAPHEVVAFVEDCQRHGTRAVSFGGGEPLQYEGLFEVLEALRGKLFRSVTTNGLLLDGDLFEALVATAPDKVHVSIHAPESTKEVSRVIAQVRRLTERGVTAGVNLVVARARMEASAQAAQRLRDAGIGNDRIVYLPLRGEGLPTPEEVATVAGSRAFQSMSCLAKCARSPRFAMVSWDRHAAWCSYTSTRRALPELSARGLDAALDGLGLAYCGDDPRLVTLSRRNAAGDVPT